MKKYIYFVFLLSEKDFSVKSKEAKFSTRIFDFDSRQIFLAPR